MARPKGRPAFSFADALRREIADGSDEPKRLRQIANKLLDLAEAGDMQAIKEVADRLDGKPKQAIVGDEDEPIALVARIERHIVKPNASDPDS